MGERGGGDGEVRGVVQEVVQEVGEERVGVSGGEAVELEGEERRGDRGRVGGLVGGNELVGEWVVG